MNWEVSTMRSRRSFFNASVLRRDISRFFPVWGIFTILLGLLFFVLVFERPHGYGDAAVPVYITGCWAIAGYALLCALTLFGDLYQSRLCNALHAMPLRREGWFFTHTAAGLLFFAVPFLCFQIILWMAGSELAITAMGTGIGILEFLLFFGLALLCVQLCGNRIGAVLLFALLNFIAPILQWLGNTLYQPLLYGVPLNADAFAPWSPLMNLMEVTENLFDLYDNSLTGVRLQDWFYLLICGGIGLVMTAGALLLYRKRALETAGDLISLRILRPVFVCAFSLLVAVALFGIMDHGIELLVLLIPYLAIGYFGGRMLVERRVNVFRAKAFLWFAILVVAIFGSLGICSMDPLGITRQVPETARIRYAEVYVHPYANGNYYQSYFYHQNKITDPAHIERLVQTHKKLTESRNDPKTHSQMLYISYYLSDGTVMRRYYPVELVQEEALVTVISSWESVFGMGYEELSQRLISLRAEKPEGSIGIFVGDGEPPVHNDVRVQVPELKAMLLQTMEKDCRDGTMAQTEKAFNEEYTRYYLELTLEGTVRGEKAYMRIEINTVNSTCMLLNQLYDAASNSPGKTITEDNVNLDQFPVY